MGKKSFSSAEKKSLDDSASLSLRLEGRSLRMTYASETEMDQDNIASIKFNSICGYKGLIYTRVSHQKNEFFFV